MSKNDFKLLYSVSGDKNIIIALSAGEQNPIKPGIVDIIKEKNPGLSNDFFFIIL